MKQSITLVVLFLILTACSTTRFESTLFSGEYITPSAMTPNADNPLFYRSTLPFETPDFGAITNDHFRPAFEAGMEQHLAEIQTITSNPEPPTFDNTLIPLEQSGELLTRVSSVFYNLASAHTNEQIQAIQLEMAPALAAHSDDIQLNSDLFSRIQSLYDQRARLGLDPESLQLLEETYRSFVRAGAQLDANEQQRLRAINERLSELTTVFQENLLTMTQERAVLFESADDLNGLSEDRLAAAREAASDRGHENGYLIQITNTTRQPQLSSIHDRSSRERIWNASAMRGLGEGNGVDNRPVLLEIVNLRSEKAQLLGHPTWASYNLEDQTAQTEQAVLDMLTDLIPPVLENSSQEAEMIGELMAADGIDGQLQPWDWEYYAEKVRLAQYEIDEEAVRPYFELNRVLTDGVFFTMEQLYGIQFVERFDIPVYHPDVRVFNVLEENGNQIGLFYADYYARDSKRGGAWMNSLVSQSNLLEKKPVILNVMNIPKPAAGEPALISFDNVMTMFHEMGHALHGLFSDVTYPSLAGTSVPRDFVEFPSTFNEDWALLPIVLENYAIHYQTGEQIPQELLEKLIAAKNFNQGFDTQEYLAATMIDLEWHMLSVDSVPDSLGSFDMDALAKYNLDYRPIPPRYHSQYFSHIFAGGYSAGYYSYIWSEVLAADAFAYMQQRGGLSRINGTRFRSMILSRGNSNDALELYNEFRGGDADVTYLLQRRGLDRDANTD